MAAAVSKIMRVQDLVLVAQKIRVVTAFRGTMGLRGLSTRLQPNHPTDEPAGIAASILDGLLYGNGDAMIGINPATDSIASICACWKCSTPSSSATIPTQSCVLTHVTTSIEAINRGVPLDLVFQSIAGTEAANAGFGINLNVLQEGYEAGLSLKRGTLGQNLMYFETGQGSACRPTPTTASTSKPAKPAPMPWPGTSSRSWSTPWSASSARNTSTTASRSSAPASKTTSAASCWACRWAATSATPTTPKPTRTTWTPC
jgi:ethanolamine ammonia-lyase large subunit